METGNIVVNNQLNTNPVKNKRQDLIRRIKEHKYLYILFLPVIVFYVIFSYIPMYGVILAFKDFNFKLGILHSPWTSMNGLKHFYEIMSDSDFKRAFLNTVIISVGRLVFEFAVPIILALLMNEIRSAKYKRVVQTVYTFPHFISWVVAAGIISNFLSNDGIINQVILLLGGQRIGFLTTESIFRPLLYITDIWKEAGWGTILYLASIAGISAELYEAAIVDGAKRLQLLRYITWPEIKSLIGIMLILSISGLMSAGFDQIFNMYNGAVMNVADILDTLIYRRTFLSGADFSSSTAMGLFSTVINFFLLIVSNKVLKKVNGHGIY